MWAGNKKNCRRSNHGTFSLPRKPPVGGSNSLTRDCYAKKDPGYTVGKDLRTSSKSLCGGNKPQDAVERGLFPTATTHMGRMITASACLENSGESIASIAPAVISAIDET